MHMHIMFEQVKVEEMVEVEDPVAKKKLQGYQDYRQQQELFIKVFIFR